VQKLFTKNLLTAHRLFEYYLKLLTVVHFSRCHPVMIILSILGKFHVKPRKNASCLYFQLTRNVHFKWNIWNFKLNFLSQGQLESLNLDRIFLTFIQNITMLWGFFGNLILAIIARMLCGNHLNCSVVSTYYDSYLIFAFFGGIRLIQVHPIWMVILKMKQRN